MLFLTLLHSLYYADAPLRNCSLNVFDIVGSITVSSNEVIYIL